ncbi:MAG: hypothetical protein OEY28_08255, partial [Nitrospira sp.]|nr:hypothetical protein [Nitrospira sp.]
LGASLYRLLTGVTMYQAPTVNEVLKKQVREPYRPITDHLPDCPPGLVKILDRMLVKNPAERYQHASQILSDLETWHLVQSASAARGGMDPRVAAMMPRHHGPDFAAAHRGKKSGAMIAIAVSLALIAIAAIVLVVVFLAPKNDGAPPPPKTEGRDSSPLVRPSNGGPSEVETPGNGNESGSDPASNSALDRAIGAATTMAGNREYALAIELLDKALIENAGASEALRKEALALRDECREKLGTTSKEAGDAQEKWDEVQIKAAGLIEEFKFAAARTVISDFINANTDSEFPGVQDVVREASLYLKEAFNEECRDRWEAFDNDIDDEVEGSVALGLEDKVKVLKELYGRIEKALNACDLARYKQLLGEKGDLVGAYLDTAEANLDQVRNARFKRAIEDTNAAVSRVLLEVQALIKKGDFSAAEQRLEGFIEKDPNLDTYGDRDEFKPVLGDLKLRKEQTRIEKEAVAYLTRGALTAARAQQDLLQENPWPADVAKLFGGADATFEIVSASGKSGEWALEASPRGKPKVTIPAVDFADPETADLLARAIAHLLEHDRRLAVRLMRPVNGTRLPSMAAIWSWLAELEAYEGAFPLIDRAFELSQGDKSVSAEAVGEFMAWALLAKAHLLLNEDKKEEAQKLLERLEQEFPDSRANRGR